MKDKHKLRMPTHPGLILEEHYIQPLKLNLDDLADALHISRNTLYKIRNGLTSVTPDIAVRLAIAFNTSPYLWLNLQNKFDLWKVLNSQTVKINEIIQIYPKPEKPNRSKGVSKSLLG